MNILDQMAMARDPFAPADADTGFGIAAPSHAAREEALAAIRQKQGLVLILGRAGMGKTLLLNLIESACRADGRAVHRTARGDIAHTALGVATDVLIIDEADTINDATLAALAPGTPRAAAPTLVFASNRSSLHRLAAGATPALVELRPLDGTVSRDFLLTRAAQAGRPDLFDAAALGIIVAAGRGSPRLLRVLAGAAMFQAGIDGAKRIEAGHASLAATMHSRLLGGALDEPDKTAAVAANDTQPLAQPTPADAPTVVPMAARRTPPARRRRDSALPFAASVALAALVLPLLFLSDQVDIPSPGVSQAIAAEPRMDGARAMAAFQVAPASAMAFDGRSFVARPAGTFGAGELAVVQDQVLATRPSVRIATLQARVIAPKLRPLAPQAVPRTFDTVRPVPDMGLANDGHVLLADLVNATRVRPVLVAPSDDEQGTGEAAAPIVPVAFAQLSSVATPTLAPEIISVPDIGPTAEVRSTLGEATGATRAVAASLTDTRATGQVAKSALGQASAARDVAAQGKAAKEAGSQAKTVKETTRLANTAKDATATAKAVANQAAAAKEAATQAKAAKDAAEQAKAAKEASEQAKAVKEAAEQAKAAKDAADQAKAAKESADQAKAVKEAAEQAKAAKDAAEQAKAAKESAEQAKAAKEAAEQAKAAKDAAEQAKAAKEAAEQAKAAKEAAEQAKAAKEAAEQAKAAKEAADQAKAAKEAAEQAKAAKEAADQAKAAKEAADLAKAAKDVAKAAKQGKGG